MSNCIQFWIVFVASSLLFIYLLLFIILVVVSYLYLIILLGYFELVRFSVHSVLSDFLTSNYSVLFLS